MSTMQESSNGKLVSLLPVLLIAVFAVVAVDTVMMHIQQKKLREETAAGYERLLKESLHNLEINNKILSEFKGTHALIPVPVPDSELSGPPIIGHEVTFERLPEKDPTPARK